MPSGKFLLRVGEKVHKALIYKANNKDVSLNQICLELLTEGLKEGGLSEPSWFEAILKPLQMEFDESLLGVVLFGSQVTGRATASSDHDLLIVLSPARRIDRSLYRWWDTKISSPTGLVVNPHFARLPESAPEGGGLWLEVALASKVLWERERILSRYLHDLKDFIARGGARRYWSHGHPFWVREDEKSRTRP